MINKYTFRNKFDFLQIFRVYNILFDVANFLELADFSFKTERYKNSSCVNWKNKANELTFTLFQILLYTRFL